MSHELCLPVEYTRGQIFTHTDPQGFQYFWHVNEGLWLARQRGQVVLLSLPDSGITVEWVRSAYENLDEEYALTTDLTQPVLLAPLQGKEILIDGNHRCFKAALLGLEEIPAYVLTQEEADAILLLVLPPG